MKPHFRQNLAKFTENRGNEAKAFNDGANKVMTAILTTGDDVHWTELELRDDGNGNPSWYIDLYSCGQGVLERERLEYLRGEIQAERISTDEIVELQSLVNFIDDGDVLLLEWAGVPEHK